MNGLFLRHFIEFLIILPCACLAILPVREHLRWKHRLFYIAVVLLLTALCALSALVCVRFGMSSLIFLPTVIICFAMYAFSLDMTAEKTVFCFLNACMLGGFVTLYVNFLAAPYEEDATIFSLPGGVLCLMLTILIIPVFFRSLSVKLAFLLDEDRLKINWWYCSVIPAVLLAVFVWSVPRDMDLVMQGRIRMIILTTLMLFPIALLLIYHACWKVTIQLTQATRLEEENNLLQMEQKRYEELRNYMKETRTLRHDFRQHLLVLSQLSADGKAAELDDYIRQITEQTVSEHPHYCTNAAVDAIAARYDDLAAERNIRVKWKLELDESLRIRETDMCTILGNLLENAIRAVRSEPEDKRWINVYARMLSKAMLGISVDNPCSHPVEMKNGFPVAKRRGHGLGLASVSATVRKYGGSMDITTKDGVFSVDILLCFR